LYYASFILAILQIINASIVLVVLLCYFLNVFAAFFGFIIKFLSHFYYLALCSCVTVFYRSLSVLCSLRLPVIIKVLSYLILSYGRPFGHNRHGPKIGGCAPFGRGELGPHVTQ